jgi:hypothetical protein
VQWGLKDIPGTDMHHIIGRGRTSTQTMFNYIKQHNTKINSLKLEYIIESYKWEAFIENSNILKFVGVIDSNQNKFSGLETMSYGAYSTC